MKILCVSAQALFPETRFGGAKRLYYLAKTLDENSDLDLIHLDGCDEVRDPEAFSPPFRRSLFLPHESLSPLELGPVVPDASKALHRHREALSAFIGGARYDATVLFFSAALYFLDRDLVRHPGKVLYLEDDLHLEQLRAQAHSGQGWARRLLKWARFLQTRNFYRKNLARVAGFICISPQEADLARKEWGVPTHLLGYGIPLRDYPLLPAPARPDVYGFIGNYRHTPNLDAARWLVETLFPALLERSPQARLVLCGAGFPDALRAQCAANPSIEVLEEVDDLAEFYGRISVFVNAIREGRGLRTKVVEAAAYGRPVLSTRLGAEGLESFDIGMFENAEELARGLEALGEPGRVADTVRGNRLEAERRFSLDAVGATLLDILSPRAARARLACVLLNYRNSHDTLACLAALARGPDAGTKIFLVNNSPDDGSSAALRAGLAESGFEHTYLEPGSNTGFAGGCNVGLRAALAENFTHAVILNNDTIPDPHFFREVRRHAEAEPRAVIAGLVLQATTLAPDHNIGRISAINGRVRHVFDADYQGKVDFVSGCLMIVPRAALETAGLFDERLFMYCEDSDLCMRFKRLGIPVRYRPSIRVTHKSSASVTAASLPKERYIQRNQAYVILRRGTVLQRLAFVGYLAALPFYKAVRHPRLLGQAVLGAWEGVIGRMGRIPT